MRTTELNQFQRFFYSHYVVTAMRLALGVLIVFLVGYCITSATTASVAAVGAIYVAFIDRPAPKWPRAKEMLAGALLGALGVSLTGFALDSHLALTVTMVGLAFFFSMLVVYGVRGATIGLACMTLAIITIPSELTPNKVVGYSLVSVAGALGYIVYSMLSGMLLQLREERQCLSVALYATAQYLVSRSDMYRDDVDIGQGYRTMIATQAQMVAAHQGARDAMLGYMSPQSVKKSPTRLMLWNLMIDMLALVDLVISTQTDYTLLHQKLPKARVLDLMREALMSMSNQLESVMVAVAKSSRHQPPPSSHTNLQQLEVELETLKNSGFAQTEPETFAICTHILRRLCSMQEIADRMAEQVQMPDHAQALQPSFLEQSLSDLISTQSFSPRLFVSNLTLNSAAFRYALRVSLAIGMAMLAGMYMPDARAHGYWIAITVIVIMKPAYSLSKERNTNRLIGTLSGCAITFGLLHITTDPDVLWSAFAIALLMCFVLVITNNYRLFSMFVSIVVLLVLHAVLPHANGLPTERAIDTVAGSVIALVCSFVLPWWESKSLPGLFTNAIKANEKLLVATIDRLKQSDIGTTDIAWQSARRDMQIAFSNFAQGFSRMMVEPVARQVHVAQYSSLVVLLHVMAAEIVNALNQVQANPDAREEIEAALLQVRQSVDAFDGSALTDAGSSNLSATMSEWTYCVKQLRESTGQLIATGQQIGLVPDKTL